MFQNTYAMEHRYFFTGLNVFFNNKLSNFYFLRLFFKRYLLSYVCDVQYDDSCCQLTIIIRPTVQLSLEIMVRAERAFVTFSKNCHIKPFPKLQTKTFVNYAFIFKLCMSLFNCMILSLNHLSQSVITCIAITIFNTF